MSGLGLQDLIVLPIVSGAAFWLVSRAMRRRGASGACEGCPSAEAGRPACHAPAPDALVTIGEGPPSPPPSPSSH
jgi:hypothetical protein